MRNLTREDMDNILYGCAILGTGGGGTLEEGYRLVNECFDAGKEFHLASIDELDEAALIGTPYGCGAISPLSEEEQRKYARLTESKVSPYVLVMNQLEQFMGRKLDAVVSTELGAMNTATAFYAAAMAGVPILDADPAGRSVPALQHSTYFLQGVPMCPMSVMNDFGEGAVFTNVFDDERGEDLVRALAVVSRNSIAVLDHVNTAAVLRNALILGATTYAEKVGKAFLDAKNKGEDVIEAVTSAANGKKMFCGVVESNDWETRDGYTFGTATINGTGECEGHTLKIWYQNENIMSWLDGEVYVTAPDLICVMNMDKLVPQMNPYAEAGENVAVFALPSPKEWTTPKGLEVFGPKYFGYDIEYKPFCE